ncbi:hypothetical protein ASPVEDRAFT_23672 [Aspergillus versicolor CBS 583.65]|uniref:Dyp-type peroxidase n=1 Tax=Aspergillus versicolor CBS 583.65 TaxID=1036611 RepID=A0A1L9P565_ASPVE|nr:uncharacterized protein ASPVEDRAFT_23672 [Aspergillus versicolor CBS 583.65]OJI96675.1 hypothetical protein ASPVEDRAFT_23672 [Aspergillus versicolor CBS 583.65]
MAPPPEVLKDLQGDIWPGLGKSHETFFLFSITKPDDFKRRVKTMVDENKITTAEDALRKRAQNRDPHQAGPEAGINVGFSPKGMQTLKWFSREDLGRGNTLTNRQFCDGAATLALDQGRDIVEDYEPWMAAHIKGTKTIHGVFIICGDKDSCEKGEALVSKMLGDSIEHIYSLKGSVRTGEAKGYEHFGFRDTISQPRLDGWDKEDPALSLPYKCRPGVIVMNHPGTNGFNEDVGQWEPEWAKNGSYFVLRKMEQDVGKFRDHAKKLAEDKSLGLNLKPHQLEARFVGRWHSGAPLEYFPKEDPARDKNGPQWDFGNNWEYKEPIDELRCPYGSHIRKSNPRNNFGQSAHNKDKSLIMRRGIPYGSDYSEATKDEKRGLLFGCYQSNVMNGYACIMDRWINNDSFPMRGSGQDVLVAQPIKGAVSESDKTLHANLYGLDEDGNPHALDSNNEPPAHKKKRCDFPGFIKIRGGEFFFNPPVSFFGRMVEKL